MQMERLQSVSIFDQIQHQRLEAAILQKKSAQFASKLPKKFKTEVKFIFEQWTELCENWESFCEQIYQSFSSQQQAAQTLIDQQLSLAKHKQKKAESTIQKLQKNQSSFKQSISMLHTIWKSNLSKMEESLQTQKEARYRMEEEHFQTLKQAQLQLATTLEIPLPNLPTAFPDDTEELLDQLMNEQVQEFSRISIEKKEATWMSEFETSKESVVFSFQEVKNALSVLSKVNMLEEELQELSKLLENDQQNQGELILQLYQLKVQREQSGKMKKFEGTSPRRGIFQESDISKTILSPGSIYGPISFCQDRSDMKMEDVLNLPSLLDELGLRASQDFRERNLFGYQV